MPDLINNPKPPITVRKVAYGFILTDADGNAAEHLNRFYRIPYYRSEKRANEAAAQANRTLSTPFPNIERNGTG
jgi:hypothetical protein